MIKDEILNFTIETVSSRLKEHPELFFQDIESLSSRNFTLKQAKIALERSTLYIWKKHHLLPFEHKVDEGKTKVWQKFSFIELCWVQFLIELRRSGIGLDHLAKIKASLFQEQFIEQLFSKPIENLDESLHEEYIRQLDETGLIKNGFLCLTPEVRNLFEQLQLSLFSCLLYATMLNKANIAFFIAGENEYGAIDVNTASFDPIRSSFEIQDLLNKSSIVFVNIRKIISDITNMHSHFSDDLKFGLILNRASVEALKKLFKDEKILEISFKLGENAAPLVSISKKMDIASLRVKFKDITQKGNYCDIIVKTRNGVVQYFEHKEIIKL